MIRKMFVFQLFVMIGAFACTTVAMARKEKIVSFDFFGQTVDVVRWDGVEYLCSQSPLVDFSDYKNVFGDLANWKYTTDAPVDIDKCYQAKWVISNNHLFLYDIDVFGKLKRHVDKYRSIEALTNQKFSPESHISANFPNGLMQATWFSGFIYLKRLPRPGESYCDCNYRCEPYMEVGIRHGEVIYVNESRSMTVYIDSTEIYTKPEYYTVKPFIQRRSPCLDMLMIKENLDDNYYILDAFRGETIDELHWHDTTFMCSESPLATFGGYKAAFPGVMWYTIYTKCPVVYEKPYMAKWTIVDDMLYFIDVELPIISDSLSDDYKDINAIRIEAIETLTNKKMVPIPSTKKNGIPATWYNGVLYFKRQPNEGEVLYSSNCSYKCEPFYKIEFEKGKVKSMEKTTYMINKKNTM